MYKRLILAILLLLGVSPLWGQPDAEQTGQGYSDDSAWARGQSWGLYGYTMMYRETLDPVFLEQARIIGRFLIDHPNLPADKIPYWDYNAPDIPDARRDASAAAIMASALIELSQLDPGEMAPRWLEVAVAQLSLFAKYGGKLPPFCYICEKLEV